MKGTILHFLKLASENEELAKDLVLLAAKYDFEFTEELSEEELGTVAGGVTIDGSVQMPSSSTEDAQLSVDFQNWLQKQNSILQMISTVTRLTQDTVMADIRNIGE